MGRSKFPGKPSKSVVKERIRVLYKNKNGKSDKDKNKNNASEVIQSNGYCFQNNFTQSNNQPISDTKSKNITNFDQANKWNKSIKEPPNKALDNENDQSQKESLDDSTKQWGQNVSSLGSCARSGNALSPNICSMEGPKYLLFELDKLIKKKTVTFQNVLETSDDSASCKKIHNPLNKGPLVSIMKKDCLTSPGCIPRGDVIVRPSRLTEILKNNENIDKTKSLSFRSVRLTSKSSDLHDGPNNEISPNIQLSNKGIKQNEINSKKENENVELQPKANHSRLHSKPLVKWKMDKVGSKIEDDEMLGDLKNDICKRSPKRKNSTVYNKIILRQPRLHFEPQCEMPGKQNEISIENNNGNSVSNNLCSNSVCGVCGTTVNSKNLQNRKYGVIACDACRKFMSKITKKTVSSTSNPTTTYKIQCSKRDGECLITSVPKNNVKSFKKIYEERCTACWLKKCIKAFHFPSGHKLRLNAILSETHKNEMDEEAANKNSDLPYHSSAEQDNRSDQISNNSNTNSEINSLSWRVITTSSGYLDPLKSYRKELTSDNFVEPLFDNNVPFEVLTKSEEGVCSNRKGMRLQLNEMPNKSVEPVICKSIEFQSANPVHTLDYPKRQKMNFRGPRVKHVCRSASIALGQQIATFTNDIEEEKTKLHSRLDIENNTFTNSVLGNIYFSKNVQENWPTNPNNALKESGIHFEVKGDILKQGFASNTVKMKRQLPKMPFPSAENPQIATIDDKQTVLLKNTFTHRQNACQFQKSAQSYNTKRNLFMLTHRNISSISKTNLMRITKTRNSEKKSQIISIDFWDTYVAAEVNQTGFGLILTEPSPICALCFVCGSMDVDYLIFCASCCEPYHSYCVQEEITPIHTIFKEKRSNMKSKNDILIQLNWVCPRCTICFTCNMSSGAKIKCQKCKKNYHSTCLGTAKGLLGADRPLICRSCLKCHTCSTTKVSKYVGNQPLCMQCFKLRISESRCPFCNNMFDNILELIILECGICEKLIHAKCEGLTEEQSYLLSNLPEKITFVCKKCSLTNDNAKVLAKQWREAIYEELKTGLLDVLKLLSRSRQANILKRNTAYNCQCDFQHSKKKPQKSPYGTETCNLKTNEDIKKWNRALNHSDKSEVFSTCDCIIGTLQKSKLSLFDVKKKIINGDYVSLFDFNADMNDIIMPLKNDDLILAYKEILSEKFSWFQNETKTCTDALEEDMFESYNYTFQSDDMIIEDQINTTKIKEPIGKLLNFLKQDSDNRVCLFCLKEGDNGILQDSRLLYSGYNTWVHANCALWSSDVYEEFDGTLQNVHYALKKGQLIKCTLCKCPGATIKCITKTCSNYYHFHCAREAHCLFNSDKSVSCSIHKSDEKCNNLIAKEAFFVFRPLYIELDKSRRTFIEPSKVQFMMGSLSVIQLGTVYSKFSDTSEAIVPINYICARLYWSCKEPWKIVKYRVRTLIQNATLANQEKNFTVDHSKNVDEVKYDLSQVANWHSSLSCEGILDSHEYVKHSSIRLSTENDPNEFISETYIEEEPQNNSDLLPPEIKDAIFEDLPHDILDGISMLDILPKLMIYEDLIAIEGKSDNVLITEAVENRALQISENCPTYNTQESNKRSSNIINHVDDTNLSTTYPKRELQRSNSEVFLRNFEGYRSQQRSSSVTWSCKFDSTRRYFTKGLSDAGLSESRDYRLNSKKTNVIFEESNHLTQVNKDKFKLMQLDGTNDTNIEYLSTQGLNENSNSPVKCDRCHCTYRTYDSFQRHLVTCEQISTSESETETSLRSPDVLRSTTFFQDESIKNNLQFYQNPLYGNQKMSSNIPVICDPNLISSDNIIPHNIYVNNTADNQDGFFININKTGYNSDIKNNIIFNNGYDQSAYQNFGDSIVNSSNKTNNKTNKLKYNFPNSNIKDNNEQYNICSNTKQDTILAPETISTVNNKAEYNTQEKHSYLQFSNQQLVLNNQYSQKEHQQQIVVIQQSVGNNQPLFIQQVQNPTTVNQNLLPVVIPNNSMQYASISPSSNPLVHGSILQTDASGNVMLSSGLQLLSMPTIQLSSQTSPQLFGTFNQPQSVHMGSNQMIIGGTGGMELMTNSNQLILSVPPVYYGLETIVQNTVMSSQQFISTAMQGVLGQNASFSATTTQVFQSSKFEPVSDIPNGYVVLNNADGSSIMVPHSNYMSGFMTTNNAHDVQSNYSHDFGNICGTHSSTFLQQTQPNSILPLIPTLSDITSIPVENPINQIKTTVNLENNVHLKPQEKQTAKFTTTLNNAILPKNSTGIINQKSITSDVEKNSMGTNECGKRINSNLRNKAQAKQKATHKYVKRSRIPKNTQINSKIMYKNEYNLTQLNETALANLNNKTKLKIERHHKTIEETNMKCKASNYTNVGNKLPDTPNMHHNVLESHMNTDEQFGAKFTIKNNFTRPNKESTSQTFLLNSTKIQQTTHPSGSNLNNGLTNIVSPILQTHQSNNTPSRPTNRVLPMQSIHKPINNHTIKKYVFENEPSDTKSNNKALPPAQSIEQNTGENQFHEIVIKDDICETKSDNIHSVNGLNPLESIPTLNDASHLKKSDNNISIDNILLDIIKKDYQQSSKAKVNENPSSENTLRDEKVDVPNKSIIDNMYMDTQLHVKAMTQNKCLDHIKITELSKLGLKCKSPNSFEVSQQCSANVCQAISPKKRVKEGPGKVAEPYLIYEIQSDDGFSYTSKSIADIWEKVFEAVQSARRAYGISSLPIGPFADMCGVQMIGLKTNALKYLIEQLPGTDKLTKYTPKYHKNTTTNVGNEFYNQDQEDLQENNYGSVRCEPFTKRSDYDIFSWLASKHRKQPKQIFVQPSDTELIARRCTANLPMAMKYRTLKETCKHNVGVFRSLIHGRGLFCIADIEAGEMVIEYAGELIRSTLTDKRERFYDSRGIGCYMFKIDDNFVVDATMRGNAARFINHSCEPNCYSKVVDILGHKHIIIFSLRRIVQGEELTYDYKFPFEDIKIPCSCCSKKCRKYLN